MPSILIIDDDPDIRELISFKLEQLGFEVHTESDGETGLAAVMQLQPDLVLLDWIDAEAPRNRGSADSYETDPTTSACPLILLTARAQEPTFNAASPPAPTTTSSSPFSPRELASRVEAVLARVS